MTDDDILDTPALRVMRTILKDGPVNMRGFTNACGHAPRHAKILREKLEERGLIVVRDETIRRLTSDKEIDLTPRGRKIAQHSSDMKALGDKKPG